MLGIKSKFGKVADDNIVLFGTYVINNILVFNISLS